MSRVTQASTSNILLSRLTASDFDALGELERIDLPVKFPQERPGEPIQHVYFPENGLSSKVAVTSGGERLEVGIVGREGMTGMAILHGASQSPNDTYIQVAGGGVRIKSNKLRDAMRASSSLNDLFLRYAQAFSVQVAHTALANGRYSIGERLARWLLMSQDRVGDELPLTHEFLSLMLGVRRAGVTEALQRLEGLKAIRATRSRITVLQRDRLEKCAGDCYGTPESEYRRLIGIPINAFTASEPDVTLAAS
jgi:CRP-like cAMP-binding protein